MPPTPALPPWTGRHFVGIDENGMGPRLGPLVVTSVLARAAEPSVGLDLATKKPRGALAKRIGDSKRLVAFDDSTLGEAWARALAQRGPTAPPTEAPATASMAATNATARPAATAMPTATAMPAATAAFAPATPAELLRAIVLDSEGELRAPCPSHHVDLCWGDAGEALVSSAADVARCAKDLDRLAAKGLDVVRVRVAIVCTRRLNDAIHLGRSRFDVDLHTMERLTLAARADAGEDVLALCGKVGGFDFYADRFGPLAGRLHTVLGEGRARSDYQVPGVGRLSFLRDAEEGHILIGLASLVGKWVRDHLMRRIVRFHRAHVPDLPDVSGYHDPASTRFIADTKLVRKKLNVDAHCFERKSLQGKGASTQGPRSQP
ncbi:MAG: hypothetical protein KIT84_32945 [Labilithrix sp.]|nr:hypothetical protein [Labilithrix sp.]MCW5815883.1 hypothetical protein [Labilithrix sp.]